ncbi:TetR/AcrR family transcriptional regulator [Virgibacillus dokdonensis]|uniref:Bacterial regulatory protein, tetR family n=1 Tax=Virgibacillus dokdonensis TaxID=302167 RepID=A0A2K9IUM0_9BACI|nr:TetR/AcrR family transcriptional regulator [Virgibacillus dokdonensis]AUJ23472.1 Bacterial regulatory protein, tetR family [Virgibacillus dokdonensis]
MATAFSNNEKEIIRGKLQQAAKECLGKYGVRKTTVDHLVQIAGISKGAFYKFYPKKEILFFYVLEDYQKSLMKELANRLEKELTIGVEQFTNFIFQLYQNVKQSFLMNLIQQQELEYLMRKIPPDIIMNHHSLDDMFMEQVFSYIKIKDHVNKRVVAASLRSIFMSMMYMEEIGEQEFDEVLKLLIKGIALQIIEEVET